MRLLRCVITITLLFAQVELHATAQPADTSPSHNLVYVEHDIPGIYHETLIPVDYGNVVLADLDGDGRKDLVYCGATRIFHTNCSDFLDRNKRGETIHTLIYYLTVTPSSITLAEGETWDDFVVTLHSEDGSTETVTPTRVVACQPNKVTFSGRAANAGPAALAFIYRLPTGQGSDLCAVCYVTVIAGH